MRKGDKSASIYIPPGCIWMLWDSPTPYIPKKRTPLGVLFFGARDGTRTHTAVATRTSNVIVYHSNTLAKPDYYNQYIPICQYLFRKILANLPVVW